MSHLSLAEATMLKRMLEDPDCRIAVKMFFDKQRLYHTEKAKDLLLGNSIEEAKRSACFALAFDTAYQELQHYAENEMRAAQ